MINLRNLTLRRGTKVVLQGANLTLHPGEKVGLIGRNGAGKSSLFLLLTDKLHADTGDVEIPPRWVIGEVAQSMPETDDGATDFVLQGDQPLQRAQAALHAAEASGDGHAMADAHMLLDEAGAFDANARAQALLLGLGFRVTELDAPVNSFSGGWRMRLQLARALMCPADLLLLDEPTNHLDLDALGLAGSLAQALRRHDDPDQPRPRVPGRHHQGHGAPGRDHVDALRRQLQLLRGDARRAAVASCGRFRQAAGAHRPSATLHRPLQGQGQQGQAGAKPCQGTGTHGKAGAGAHRVGLRVRVPRAAEPAQPDAGLRRPGLRLRQHRHRQEHQPLGAGRPAHRHPRCQRPGQVDAGQDHRPCAAAAGRHHDRRQGPGHRLLRAAGTGRAAARRRAADAHGAAGTRCRSCRARAGAARLPRPVPLHRRHGQPGGGFAVGRRKGAAGAGHAGVAAPQPAAAGRTDQPPRPDDARGAVDRAQRVRRHRHAGQP